MRSLENRVRVLEASNRAGACLECECERLNMQALDAAGPHGACSHRHGLTLLDALNGLNQIDLPKREDGIAEFN